MKLPTDNLPKEVSGIVEADETFFVESFKVNHSINDRPAHRRGGEGKKNRSEGKISVLIVRDRQGNVCDYVLDNLSKVEIQQHLKTIVNPDSILCSDGASWYQSFAKEEGIAHH